MTEYYARTKPEALLFEYHAHFTWCVRDEYDAVLADGEDFTIAVLYQNTPKDRVEKAIHAYLKGNSQLNEDLIEHRFGVQEFMDRGLRIEFVLLHFERFSKEFDAKAWRNRPHHALRARH